MRNPQQRWACAVDFRRGLDWTTAGTYHGAAITEHHRARRDRQADPFRARSSPLERHGSLLGELEAPYEVLSALARILEDNEGSPGIAVALERICRQMMRKMAELKRALAESPYPFEHADGRVSVADYALKSLPVGSVSGRIHGSAGEMLEKLNVLRYRILGELIRVALEVEGALGFARLAPVE